MKSLRIFAHIDQDSFDNPIRMPSVAEINAFADSIGVKFPDEYVLFIKKYAGHFIHYDVGITVKDVLPNGQYILFLRDLGLFFHYDVSRDNDDSIQRRYEWYQSEYRAKKIVPISRNSVEGDIAFDFRKSLTEPRIVLTNVYNWVPDIEGLKLAPVAISFSRLLENLITREEFKAKYGFDGTVSGSPMFGNEPAGSGPGFA